MQTEHTIFLIGFGFGACELLHGLFLSLGLSESKDCVECNDNVDSQNCSDDSATSVFKASDVEIQKENMTSSVECGEGKCEHQKTEEEQVKHGKRCLFGVIGNELFSVCWIWFFQKFFLLDFLFVLSDFKCLLTLFTHFSLKYNWKRASGLLRNIHLCIAEVLIVGWDFHQSQREPLSAARDETKHTRQALNSRLADPDQKSTQPRESWPRKRWESFEGSPSCREFYRAAIRWLGFYSVTQQCFQFSKIEKALT